MKEREKISTIYFHITFFLPLPHPQIIKNQKEKKKKRRKRNDIEFECGANEWISLYFRELFKK